MKATDYKVIEKYSVFEFSEEVRKWVRAGWQPLGSVAVSSSDTGRVCYYVQAMILPEPEPKTGGEQ